MSKIEVKIPKTINKTCIGFPPVGIAFLGSVHGNAGCTSIEWLNPRTREWEIL